MDVYHRMIKGLKGNIKYKRITTLMIMITVAIALLGCTKNTIKIGYIADLSALTSQLGVDARNALLLRVDQINEQGGVDGDPIEVIIKDDKGDPETAERLFDEFKNEEIKFVVGPLTSSMAIPALKAQSEEMLIVSPSISGDLATGIDDFFLRTCQLNTQQAKQLSDFMTSNGYLETTVLYSKINKEYTETLSKSFKEQFQQSGGKVAGMINYDSTDDLQSVTTKLISLGSSNTVIVSSSIDTAIIQQLLKKLDPNHQSFGINWAMTNDLIDNGGRAVEGMYFVGNYSTDIKTDDYTAFSNAFYERYDYEASFITYWTYDAIEVLVYGLRESKELTPKMVKETILNKGDFVGINQNFTIDQFGDSNKQYTIYQLVNGTFEKVE